MNEQFKSMKEHAYDPYFDKKEFSIKNMIKIVMYDRGENGKVPGKN